MFDMGDSFARGNFNEHFVTPSPIPRKSQDPRAQFDKAGKFKMNMNMWLCCIMYYFNDMGMYYLN